MALLLSLLACLPARAQAFGFEDRFTGAQVSADRWTVRVGGGASSVRLEPRDQGQCVHLFGDHATTEMATKQAVPDIAYTLEYEFLQPGQEVGGYQAVAQHRRPQGSAYWWLEYGPERFFLYTIAGGHWYNRWQAYGVPTDRWCHVRIRNTPTAVRIRILDGERLVAESPPIPHDDGDPAPISFGAVGTENGVWGMKLGNVRLSVTPVAEREDYVQRRAALEGARAALGSQETQRLWPQAAAALQPAAEAFEAIGKAPPEDWPAYVKAGEAFDAALNALAEQYHESVLARLEKSRNGWAMVDLQPHLTHDAALEGLTLPWPGPVAESGGIPFAVLGFGRNCLLQDRPSRSEHAVRLEAQASRVGLLLAPTYDAELYSHDDSLVDVLQVELRYADGFRERIAPAPAGWQPPTAVGVGRPPMANGRAEAYLIEPGHAAGLSEVVLCDAATQAGWALFGLSYQPGLPAELPLIRAAPKPRPSAARAIPAAAANELAIANGGLRLVLDRERGVVRQLLGDACGEVIPAGGASPLFAVQIGDQLRYSDGFRVMSINARAGPDQGLFEYALSGPEDLGSPLLVTVQVDARTLGAMKLRATVRNRGQQAVTCRLLFPLLDGLDLGERPGWWFPQRGGAASDLAFEGLSSYGGMAWMQLLDAHRAEGGGLYLRCDDDSGVYKVFSLRSAPEEQAQPRRVAEIPEPAHPVDPWRAKKGVHLSVQYLPRTLAPGASWSTPGNTLADHAGDWRAALADYRAWLKTWWKPVRPCPERYRYGFFALVGGTPGDDQRGEEFGSYDWWHLSPFWTIDYPDELTRELGELTKQGERAAKWGEAVGVYIEGMCLDKKRRIAREHGAEWAMKDDRGAYYTYYSTEASPVWNMCPAVKGWREWDAGAYAGIARRVPLCAMYVDSTGSRWAEVCYNADHGHETPGIWPRGCGELFESIRQSVMQASPETAIHSEEPGCDYMALHEDGSWSHSLWTSVSGDAECNPAGLNYFHFALPEFKMYEIPSYRHALWRCKLAFFNGEGLWTNVPDALRRALFIRWLPTLREHAETFLSEDSVPAAPLVTPPLYANLFRRGPQAIYTVYNAGLRTRTAEIALPLPTSGHAFDLLALEELPFRARGQEALVRLTLDPHEVKCFLVTPRLMRAAVQGHALRGSLPNGTVGGRLVAALIDDEGVRRQTKEIDTTGDPRQLTVNLRDLFGEARGRMLLRIAGPYATADEMVVRRQ